MCVGGGGGGGGGLKKPMLRFLREVAFKSVFTPENSHRRGCTRTQASFRYHLASGNYNIFFSNHGNDSRRTI